MIDLGLIQPRFYTVPGMKTVFATVNVDIISSFVEEINFFFFKDLGCITFNRFIIIDVVLLRLRNYC